MNDQESRKAEVALMGIGVLFTHLPERHCYGPHREELLGRVRKWSVPPKCREIMETYAWGMARRCLSEWICDCFQKMVLAAAIMEDLTSEDLDRISAESIRASVTPEDYEKFQQWRRDKKSARDQEDDPHRERDGGWKESFAS